MAYSLDLREKETAAIDRGEKKSHVSRTLKISRNTLDLWLKRRQETGSVAPKQPVQPGPEPKIKDLDAFKKFALAQPLFENRPSPSHSTENGRAVARTYLRRDYRKSTEAYWVYERKRRMGTARGTKLNEQPSCYSLLATRLNKLSTSMKQESMTRTIIPMVTAIAANGSMR